MRVELRLEISKRLDGAIERAGLPFDRERAAKSVTHLLVPEVLKIVQEEIRATKANLKGETHGK
ncbi:MAG: hypothetical protein WCA19_02230 [Candidatus Acidiferrales bacterium]